ncbi:hypothetical protein Poly51_11780 [Rubripirellula tenax]|uniref:Uncharacterized protein n=1 Tax=Rubripirellula tenax TaxID=2528015 RepID=A0A5C6FGN5_9BACT|nr:hypothetical protein [Rubripirellula tenax]TWU60896.1 hypothetical protein Poly51_11780 [Rubripirellula tenax]
MNASSQYWFMLAAFVSLAVAATVALRRYRSTASILYACSAWLALLFGSGLLIEPMIANETFVAPDGSVTIHYNMTLHVIMSWGLTFTALLCVVASVVYVITPFPKPIASLHQPSVTDGGEQ